MELILTAIKQEPTPEVLNYSFKDKNSLYALRNSPRPSSLTHRTGKDTLLFEADQIIVDFMSLPSQGHLDGHFLFIIRCLYNHGAPIIFFGRNGTFL